MIWKTIKALVVLLFIAFIGLAVWGWAPDGDVSELRSKYGATPSTFVKLDNGQTLHVRDEGPRDGPVLLLLHGSNASLHTWEPWAEILKKNYRVIRYDQAGHGLTGEHPSDDYSAKAFSETAARLMSKLGIDSYSVAGNSMGGWIAWNHALAFPNNVEKLVLVDASGVRHAKATQIPIGFKLAANPFVQKVMTVFTPREIIARSIRQSVSDPEIVDDAMIDRYWELIRYPGNRAATGKRFSATRVFATPEKMKQLEMPTFIIWGEDDKLIPLAAGKWFDRTIPDSTLVSYPNIGHAPMEEAAEKTASDLVNWMNATDRKKDGSTETVVPPAIS